MRLVGRPPIDWPAEVGSNFACFETNLESTMRAEIGADVYDSTLQECQRDVAIPKRSYALKNPAVIAMLIEGAKKAGRSSVTLETIVRAIEKLR
jgi:putative ATP-dependent endonuclease of the OLD family